MPYAIYYASNTFDEAQQNYITTEKELLVLVYAVEKFAFTSSAPKCLYTSTTLPLNIF